MTDKIYSFIGLATRAGRLVSGEFACENAMKKHEKLKLVIVAKDASENTKKKFRDACGYRNIPIRYFGEKELLGKYTGKETRAIVAITDKGFSTKLLEMIDGLELQYGGEQFGKV